MTLRTLALLTLLAASAAAWPAPARAQQDPRLLKAQEAFDQAQVLYLKGDYQAAAAGFQAAYAARAFPQFLYNIGASYHMKGKQDADVDAYRKAIEHYQRYLAEEPKAPDRAKVERSIQILEQEIQRLRAPQADPAAPAPAPSTEVQQLGDVRVRGLVVIESEPQGASIYLGGKEKGEMARTPWSGTLEGEHTYVIEKRGYKSTEGSLQADPSRLYVLRVVLSEQDYLGWVEIRSNVPGASVFVDDKAAGEIGKTPYSGNFTPGKHTFWVSADGYDEFQTEIEVIAGEARDITATLQGAPVGYLNLRGTGIDRAEILVDGKVLCQRGPCRKPVREGTHTVTVRRPGYKPYTTRIDVQARTEITVTPRLARKPGRRDAVTAYVASGLFAGGGIYLGLRTRALEDELQREIAAGMPPPDRADPRFLRGKIFAISADAAFAVSGVVALTAVYYTFRDKGPPSTGTVDVRALSLQPQVGPGYAGFGVGGSW
jgi:tetratricopeptide (TPR) repeat protein